MIVHFALREFLSGLTKKQLKQIDKELRFDDVEDYHGWNYTKADIVSHLAHPLEFESVTSYEVDGFMTKCTNLLARVSS